MNYALEATYYRTGLLLGLVRGEAVCRWAADVIEHDPVPSPAFFEIVSLPPTDLSGLRSAVWPLVLEPDPPDVLRAILGLVHADLASGRRQLADTLTVLRQMRSMLRLPPSLYADLNAALVEQADPSAERNAIARWLRQFDGCGLAQLRSRQRATSEPP